MKESKDEDFNQVNGKGHPGEKITVKRKVVKQLHVDGRR